MKQAKSTSSDKVLAEILSIIRDNPGIRPLDINRLARRNHSAYYRSKLIKQGLIRKEKEGSAVHYYPTK